MKISLLLLATGVALILAHIIAANYIRWEKIDKKLEYVEQRMDKSLYGRLHTGDEYTGWRPNPGIKHHMLTSDYDIWHNINSKGIRDKEISYEKPPGEFRIVVVGESNVFGEGVSYGERFSEVIETALNNVEVVNMGVGGFGVDQAFLFLEKEGFKYEPDVVVLLITINDFLQRAKYKKLFNANRPFFQLNENQTALLLQLPDIHSVMPQKPQGSSPGENKGQHENGKTLNPRKRNGLLSSPLFVLGKYYLTKRDIDRRLRQRDEKEWEKSSQEYVKREEHQTYTEEEFRVFIKLLFQKYKELCSKQNADFLVIFATPEDMSEFTDLCEELGIECWDLQEVVVNASKYKPLSFEIDPHRNPFFHRVAGEYMRDYLKKKYHFKGRKYRYKFLGRF